MKSCVAIILLLCSCRITQTDQYIANLKSGRIQNDTTPVYVLPYLPGSSYMLVQANHSSFSHKGEFALDFKMTPGSAICAARDGVVIATKQDSDVGGLKNEFLSQGNHVIIQHVDKSQGMYWHLIKNGVTVNIGDSVKAGQLIGYSGNTGYTAFPHLHFEVNAYTPNGFEQVPTRFYTSKGVGYLRPGKWYKAIAQ